MVLAAALAVCLLALAAGASAQCTRAGEYIKFDLAGSLDTSGSAPFPWAPITSPHPIELCLTGFTATIVNDTAGTGCALQITPSNSGGSYIPGMWTGKDAIAGYGQWLECPTDPGYKHPLASVATGTLETALMTAIGAFPYGVDGSGNANKPLTPSVYGFPPGGAMKITIAGPKVLYYAITEVTLNATDTTKTLVVDGIAPALAVDVVPSNYNFSDPAGWLTGNEFTNFYHNTTDVDKPCGVNYPYNSSAYLYGHVLGERPNEYKICSLCPAGTSGFINGSAANRGYGCTPCPAGQYSVPGGACTDCPPGTYAQAGSSQCLPCPTGTFSTYPGAKNCYECPEDSYAWIPGSQYCMRCNDGVPEACPAANTTAPSVGVCPSAVAVSSPGYAILQPTGSLPNPTCSGLTQSSVPVNIPSWGVKAMTACQSWDIATPSGSNVVAFALRIAGDCSIQISPVRDQSCADPSADYNETAASPTYPYGALEMRAYYAPPVPVTSGSPAAFPTNSTGVNTNKASFRIVSLFDTFADAVTSPPNTTTSAKNSYMVTFTPGSGDAITMSFFVATTDPKTSVAQDATYISTGTATNVCDAPMALVGGQLFSNLVDSSADTCTPGTYWDADLQCVPCPVGYTCPGGNSTGAGLAKKLPCPPNTYSPFLGMDKDCLACPSPRWTSYEGAANCSVAAYDPTCLLWSEAFGNSTGTTPTYLLPTAVINAGTGFPELATPAVDPLVGLQFDLAAQDCVKCPAGTYRDLTAAVISNDCTLCPAGTYSDAGDYIWGSQTVATDACIKCPKGQYNPLEGLPNQNDTTNSNTTVCIECAVGSVALPNGTTLAAAIATPSLLNAGGAVTCEPCPAGTYQDSVTLSCTACPAGTYRSGDATPENNVCKDIPAGYKLKAASVSPEVLASSEIELCDKGTVSFWAYSNATNASSTVVRVPAADLTCAACSTLDSIDPSVNTSVPYEPKWANTFAPRKGMTQCIPCPGGTIPNVTATVTDTCIPCPTATYRDAYTVSATCFTCPVGREVGPNSKMACTDCRPGFYKNETTTNNCSPCPKNYYRPTFGASSCLACPRGTQTANTGNIECTSCPIGYYNNAAGTDCTPAPAGTFVNVTGSFVTALCPKGSWNNELAQDNCNPCAPGKYSNVLGAKECKTCPAGTYSGGQASSCINCRAGYFAPAGAGACSPCKPSTYAPDVKSATCKLCPKGFQCPTNAMRLQAPCPRGTFSNKEGNRLCTPCPENTYSLGGGLGAGGSCSITNPCAVMACTKCPAGTNTRGLVGQSKCQVIRPQVRRLRL